MHESQLGQRQAPKLVGKTPALTRGKTVALTGATGFIGQRLSRQLTHAGASCRALVRRGSSHRVLAGIDAVEGSLDDSEACAQLVREADAVVYCAGAVRGRVARDFEQANVVDMPVIEIGTVAGGLYDAHQQVGVLRIGRQRVAAFEDLSRRAVTGKGFERDPVVQIIEILHL